MSGVKIEYEPDSDEAQCVSNTEIQMVEVAESDMLPNTDDVQDGE